MAEQPSRSELLVLTSDIVAAHVASNAVGTDELKDLIRTVFAALRSVGAGAPPAARPEPAVPIRRSVARDHIVCLEDGKKLKMLKRYLMSRYTMTPSQYRERWGLPHDYPMVAPDYAARRSALAKQIGLGTQSRERRRG